jgi:hypothetical protein
VFDFVQGGSFTGDFATGFFDLTDAADVEADGGEEF